MSLKPRLLILTNRLVIGGMAIEVLPLVYYLQKDFDIDLMYGEKEADEKEVFYLLKYYPGISLKKIPGLNKKMNIVRELRVYRYIRKEIRANKYTLVHTHGSKTGFIGRIAARSCDVECIIHTFHGHLFHSYFNRTVSQMLVMVERWLARFTDHIIATSKRQKEELTEIYKIASPAKISVINLGVDIPIFLNGFNRADQSLRDKYFVSGETVAIGIIARIVPVKNFDLFAEVVKKIILSSPSPVKFFVIGDGELKADVQKNLCVNGIAWCDGERPDKEAHVIFTSWIEQIVPALKALDIVMLTSNNEGTALALVEAQICGIPVVATDVGGVKDTFIDGESGFLVTPGNADEFADKLVLLIRDKSLRENMGKRAAVFAAEKFSKTLEIEKVKELYNNCIHNANNS